MVIIMASLSLSLCIAVVVIIPLLSTIVFVGLLDFGCCHCLCVTVVVVTRWSSSWHCHHCLFVLQLSSLSPCCQPLFLLDCWILAIIIISLCCCHHTIVFVVAAVVVCFGSSSLLLCIGVVIVVPLLSTIVLVGLLDCWIVGLLDCWIVDCLLKKILYLMFVFEIILGIFRTEHVPVWTDSLAQPTFN